MCRPGDPGRLFCFLDPGEGDVRYPGGWVIGPKRLVFVNGKLRRALGLLPLFLR